MRGIKNTLFLGIWLFLVPFLGVPASWKDGLILATAFFLIVISGGRLVGRLAQSRGGGAERSVFGEPQETPLTGASSDSGGGEEVKDITMQK